MSIHRELSNSSLGSNNRKNNNDEILQKPAYNEKSGAPHKQLKIWELDIEKQKNNKENQDMNIIL